MKPSGKIDPQPLTVAAITPTTVLVDDLVALVDDPNTLVGSQVVPSRDIRVNTKPFNAAGQIVPRR